MNWNSKYVSLFEKIEISNVFSIIFTKIEDEIKNFKFNFYKNF